MIKCLPLVSIGLLCGCALPTEDDYWMNDRPSNPVRLSHGAHVEYVPINDFPYSKNKNY